MIPRGLLCAALLLAIVALPLPSPAQATSTQPDAEPAQPETGTAEPDNVSQPNNSTAQPEAAAAPALSSLRVDCTPASRAYTMIGQHGCVAGRVYRVVHTHQGNIRLYLCRNRSQCSFHATVYANDRKSVGDLWYLRGRVVAIVGDITEFHDSPEIVIADKEQIQVASEDVPQEFDAAEPRPIGRGRGGRRNRAW